MLSPHYNTMSFNNMRESPANSERSSFDGSAFFGDDSENFFAGVGELSKFESFIERKSNRTLAAGNNNNDGPPNNVISPRSDDGMSMVSRMKHNNYANVVQEMKKKQSLVSGRNKNRGNVPQQQFHNSTQQQHPQQQPQDWGFADAFGGQGNQFASPSGSNNAQRSNNQNRTMHQSPSLHQQSQNDNNNQFGWSSPQDFSSPQNYGFQSTPRRSGNGHASYRQQNNDPPTQPPGGGGGAARGRQIRKLYRDQPNSTDTQKQQGVGAGHNNNNNNNMRSRSTIRRTQDHARKLAEQFAAFDDGASDFASGGGSDAGRASFATASSSMGSGEELDFAGFADFGGGITTTSGSRGGHYRRTSSGSSSFVGDNFPAQQQQLQQQTHRQGSYGQQQQQQRQSSTRSINPSPAKVNQRVETFDDNSSVASFGSCNASVAARRRAKAAFKGNLSSPGRNAKTSNNVSNGSSGGSNISKLTPPAIPPPSNPSSGARRNMRMKMRTNTGSAPASPGSLPWNGNGASSKSWPKTQNAPSQETGEPMFDAFGIDSNEIDDEVNMALSELQISLPDIEFDFHRHSTGGSVDSSVNTSCGPPSPPQAKMLFQKSASHPKQSSDEGTIRTRSTKSMTEMEFSMDSNTLPQNRHLASSKPSEGEGGVSPVISVEQYSESSSLTDTSDWHVNQQQQQQHQLTQKQNMFKEASQGSTFHKSKKIVRPGESIPENVAASPKQSIASTPTNGSTFYKVQQSLPPVNDNEEEHAPPTAVDVKPTSITNTSSVSERISKIKSKLVTETTEYPGIPPTPSHQLRQAMTPSNSVKDSPFCKKTSASSIGTPQSSKIISTPTANTPASNPFAVKLRNTKNTPDANEKRVSSSSPYQGRVHSNDSTALNYSGVNDDYRENSSNAFLSNVKLRKTGSTPQKVEESSDSPAMRKLSSKPEEECDEQKVSTVVSQIDEPKKNVSYREARELLKKAQEEEVHSEESEEQKKDVATLIRERIAASKKNADISNSSSNISEHPESTSFNDFRSTLKKTTTPSRPSALSDDVKQFSKTGSTAKTIPSPSPQSNDSLPAPTVKVGEFCRNTVPKTLDPTRETRLNSAQDEGKSDFAKESDADPRAALMAMLSKRTQPKKQEPESELDPKANLAAMFEKRSAQANIGASTPTSDKSAAKANLSAMLQKRPSPQTAESQSSGDAKNALSAMLANRAPPGVVKNSEEQNQSSSSDGRPALKNDPTYEKYFKMLKVGMPLPVVQHAMTRDGLDSSVMEGDHNEPAPGPKPDGIPLKDDPAYTKYFKMLKLGLPMGAVKNAMSRDGLDSSIMDGDHNAPVSSSTPDISESKKREKDTHRRTRLHWDTLNKVKSNTVWALVEEDQELEGIEIDEKEFLNLFQVEIKAPTASSERNTSAARNVVQVIDPKRANNGGIILARLRMSYDDLANVVEIMDETAMTANQAQGIIEYMPTSDERKALRNYMKASNGESAAKFEKLCECEKFMVAMMTVKQSKRKLRALLFKLQFRGCIHDLAHDVFSIEKACDELNNSIRLRKLFGIVLNIGNRLNTAGPGEKRKAGAFSIKSLLKLNQAKAFDNKTTFLHYVVLVVQRNNEDLLDFKEDLPTVSKADKIFWDQCVNELEEVETQLENVRKLALYEAKSKKVVYQLPNKKKQTQEDVDSDDLSVASMSLEEEVAMLRSTKIGMFALSAIKKVSQLRERVDTAKNKFSQLLEYFGEDGENSKMQPHELLQIISTFCRNFDAAREDVVKMEKAKKRSEKKQNTPDDSSSTKSEGDTKKNDFNTKKEKLTSVPEHFPPVKKSPAIPRSSSLQPNMSNVLADLKRATSARFQSAMSNTSEAPINQSPTQNVHHIAANVTTASASPIRNVTQQGNINQPDIARKRSLPKLVTSYGEECDKHSTPIARDSNNGVHNQEQCNTIHRKTEEQSESVNASNYVDEAESAHVSNVSTKAIESVEEYRPTPQSLPAEVREPQIITETSYGCVGCDVGNAAPTPKDSNSSTTPSTSRRDRARNRRFIQSSPSASAQVSGQEPSKPNIEPVSSPARSHSEARTPSNANARASARERYARHKKLIQQRHSST